MHRYEYSDEIVNVVKKFLAEDNWHYSFNEDTGIFRFGLRLRSKIQNISYLIDVHDDEFIVYGMCPIAADRKDPEMMAQRAEFICHANFGMKNGCFELDRDVEIRFRSFVDCEDLLPSTSVVKNSVYCTAAMFKRYAAGIVDIIFGGAKAKDAITKCEGDLPSTENELMSALKEALGGDVSEEAVGAFISHLTSELGIGKDSNESHEDDDRPKDIRLNPFADEGGGESGQSHIKTDLFGVEGGEA